MLTQACKFMSLVRGNNPVGFKKSEKKAAVYTFFSDRSGYLHKTR